MGALFGSLGALFIGLSDLFGRRVVVASSALTAAVGMQFIALITSLAATRLDDGEVLVADLGLGALSGVGLGIGLSCYYGGLARSSSTVVAPLVATLAAVIPFAYTVTTGAAPTALGWAGALVAFSGLVLISIGGDGAEHARAGVAWGTISGLGYGFGTAALADLSDAAGQWPAVSQRGVAFLMLTVVAVFVGLPITPPAGLRGSAILAGILAGLTTIAIIVGVAHNARATVVTVSMFPAFSVAIGWLFFRDGVSRRQLLGLIAVLVGVAGVVAG